MTNWTRKLTKLRACEEAVKWGSQFDTIDEAWQKCERGDWMLWLLGKLCRALETDSRKKLVLCACEVAGLALPHVVKGETGPLKAIETAEKYARGEGGVTLRDVRTAADAAAPAAPAAALAAAHADAAAAYAADAAAYAASAAAYAADAYAADADAAYAATYAAAAYAYADAAYAADADAAYARATTLKQCANIVRKHYPEAPNYKGVYPCLSSINTGRIPN